MYRRPKFLERLIEIRQEMAFEADYDIDLFAELARSGAYTQGTPGRQMDEPDQDLRYPPKLPSGTRAE